MRKEFREYNYDWMLWSAFETASRIKGGTEKEYRRLLSYIPHFRGILESLMIHEEVSVAFIKMASSYLRNVITAHERRKKLAATTFCFSPAIFYSMDIVPVTLEVMTAMGLFVWKRGTSEYLDYCCEVGFTETSCSSQRGSLGAYLAGLGEKFDFIVCDTPGICDTNANAFSFAASYLDIPVYCLGYPPTLTDSRAEWYHREDFKGLISFLENQTGKTLDAERLKDVLQEIGVQDEIISEIEDLQRLVPNPAPVEYGFFLYTTKFLFAGTKECTEFLKLMLEKVRENAEKGISGLKSGRERLRALFCYIDHYASDIQLWQMLDRQGVTSPASILSTFWHSGASIARGREDEAYGIDTNNIDTMIDSIAALNSRMPMVKSIRGPYDSRGMWLDDTLGLAKLYSADCIIYSGTPGCRNTWGMVKMLARDTEKYGYPTHLMYSDAFDSRIESWEVTCARLEEFFKVRRLLK
ncbi:MAG: 2-hydroxyacyl-CoA dehydratase subunit D [Bacillota bacterium]